MGHLDRCTEKFAKKARKLESLKEERENIADLFATARALFKESERKLSPLDERKSRIADLAVSFNKTFKRGTDLSRIDAAIGDDFEDDKSTTPGERLYARIEEVKKHNKRLRGKLNLDELEQKYATINDKVEAKETEIIEMKPKAFPELLEQCLVMEGADYDINQTLFDGLKELVFHGERHNV